VVEARPPARPLQLVGVLGGACFGPEAAQALAEAEVVMGARRHLESGLAANPSARRVPFGSDLRADLVSAATLAGQGLKVCVLASGDPGFFGLARLAGEVVGPGRIEVHPSPSSVALAFGRAGLSWEDAVVVSAHGRPPEPALEAVRRHPKVAVLTSPELVPEVLGRKLLAGGCGARQVLVASRLGEEDQALWEGDLAGLAKGSFDPLSVVVFVSPDWRSVGPSLSWGLHESALAHRAGMITKAEVRAVALGKLDLPLAGVLWDVGAGSGSLSLECRRLAPGLEIYAIERSGKDLPHLEENLRGLGVRVVAGSAPYCLEDLPDPDRVFVGGGGIEVVEACFERLRPGGTLVATFAALERAAAAASLLGDLCQLVASRAKRLPDGSWRLEGANPVFVAWGSKAEPAGEAAEPAGEAAEPAGEAAEGIEARSKPEADLDPPAPDDLASNQHVLEPSRVLCVSISRAGAALAAKLPFEHRRSSLVETVRSNWSHRQGFVLIAPLGVAVRAIAPLLGRKDRDPAVVCLDDAGAHAVAVVGGHRGANQLARLVGSLCGAEPVVTTATDLAGRAALDNLRGFRAEGDVAGVTRAWLDGEPPSLAVTEQLSDWPLPAPLAGLGPTPADPGGPRVVISDRREPPSYSVVHLRPPSLVLGVGASSGADPDQLRRCLEQTLARHGLSASAIAAVATLDRKVAEPAIAQLASSLGVPLSGYDSTSLANAARTLPVPNPSAAVMVAVGTPSVAEAAALLAAGPGATLVQPKVRSASGDSTLALARRRRPVGRLSLVGLGPGAPALRTLAAVAALRRAEVVVGYEPYLELAQDLLESSQLQLGYPIGQEEQRCREAIAKAREGREVALVCSGDPGVYAMASLVCELLGEDPQVELEVCNGVSAAYAGAALLGAPLGHDHALLSLSDLLTPWELIERRLEALGQADMAIAIYNPRSAKRHWQLARALEVLARWRPPMTPAAVLKDLGRPTERVVRATVATLDPTCADMTSLVLVGSSQTRWEAGRMVTPRGYLSPQERP